MAGYAKTPNFHLKPVQNPRNSYLLSENVRVLVTDFKIKNKHKNVKKM